MAAANLLTSPRWTDSQLGLPMPDSQHAVSACLPLWAHNIGYEEGDAAVIDRLEAAYPRFCLHPLVRKLRSEFLADQQNVGLIFPSGVAALRAAEYVVARGGKKPELRIIPGQDATAVVANEIDFSFLKEYWQHAGEVLSSRAAEQILAGHRVTYSETPDRKTIRHRIAVLQGTSPDDVLLFPSGMAAIAAAWRTVRRVDPVSRSVQFGFPYVDTLKIQQRFPPADCMFFPLGSEKELNQLEAELSSHRICAVFCETPTNPLLYCPDLTRLRELADRHNFLLVVDDTLAACLNLNVLPLADLVVTSLTKFFSGYGDVLAGSVTINPASPHYSKLRTLLTENFTELLSDADAAVLERNSRDLDRRVTVINQNADQIADRLSKHPAVEQVWHPSIHRQPEYTRLKRPDGGNGGLLSFVLRNPSVSTPRVFDALSICKGPNLGTTFTLCCPYTILAHYTELATVEKYGVSRWLLRVSVGTEPLDELWKRFEIALRNAE
ncbi:MAG: aminotransferase class I/II-fold pyridoxal phosphate-dependent enzyme [Planctomyces sp.]|jgi:cystathionine gamma-synthase